MKRILHKIYDEVDDVKDDLVEFQKDTEKLTFLEFVLKDRQNFFIEESHSITFPLEYDGDIIPMDQDSYVSERLGEDFVTEFCYERIAFYKSKILLQEEQSGRSEEKIPWNAPPSVFGHVFLEFVKVGMIPPPLRNGEINYAGLAKLCFRHFKINTTLENLIREMNPGKNSLSETKRLKFPDLADLG